MMDRLLSACLTWLVGAPIYLPGILNLLGIYKSWYLAPSILGVSWKGIVHAWPASAVFVCFPFIALLPLSNDVVMKVWASVSVAGIVLTVVLGTWNPRWLKPAWQRRLEDRYSRDQIETFIRVWRQMDRREWGRLIETEEGLEELVRRARGPYWREPTRDELEREMGELEETLAHETGPEMRQHLVRLMKRLKSRLESLEKC